MSNRDRNAYLEAALKNSAAVSSARKGAAKTAEQRTKNAEHRTIAVQKRLRHAEETLSEAIRWAELEAASKSPGAPTAARLLEILKKYQPASIIS